MPHILPRLVNIYIYMVYTARGGLRKEVDLQKSAWDISFGVQDTRRVQENLYFGMMTARQLHFSLSIFPTRSTVTQYSGGSSPVEFRTAVPSSFNWFWAQISRVATWFACASLSLGNS